MKKPLSTLLILLSFVTFGYGFKLQWSSNPPGDAVTAYTVYEHVGTSFNQLAVVTPVAGATQTWPIPAPTAGAHLYDVSATNLRGESAKSSDVLLPDAPTQVVGLVLLP